MTVAQPASPFEKRLYDQRTAINADQTEFTAVMLERAAVGSGISDDRIAGAMDDYEPQDEFSIDDWAIADSSHDNAVSDIALELKRRKSVLKGYYPFIIEGNEVSYVPSKTLVYEFCLAVSLSPSLTQKPFNALPIAFEHLSKDVVCCFLGPGGDAYRTGWPPKDPDKRPSKFKSMAAVLNDKTGEWCWAPALDMPEDPNIRDVKDEGIDFVVWKSVQDGRKGQLFLFGQCACGKTDWWGKLNDINFDRTSSDWFSNRLSTVRPMKAFVTPHHIPNTVWFDRINRQAGLTFDRTRLTLIAEAEENREKFTLQATVDYQELIQLVLDHN